MVGPTSGDGHTLLITGADACACRAGSARNKVAPIDAMIRVRCFIFPSPFQIKLGVSTGRRSVPLREALLTAPGLFERCGTGLPLPRARNSKRQEEQTELPYTFVRLGRVVAAPTLSPKPQRTSTFPVRQLCVGRRLRDS